MRSYVKVKGHATHVVDGKRSTVFTEAIYGPFTDEAQMDAFIKEQLAALNYNGAALTVEHRYDD